MIYRIRYGIKSKSSYRISGRNNFSVEDVELNQLIYNRIVIDYSTNKFEYFNGVVNLAILGKKFTSKKL